MLASPLKTDDAMCVSSGSWSVMTIQTGAPALDSPVVPRFTHEGCWGNKSRLIYNLVGLWMVQRLRREFAGFSYGELEEMAADAEPFRSVFVPEQADGMEGELRSAIAKICADSGQYVPRTAGEFVRAVYDSLAVNYRALIKEAELFLGRPIRSVCVVGGGARSRLLNEATAEATGLPVTTGPAEAAVMGNMFAQMMAAKEIGGTDDIGRVLENSGEINFYEPRRMSAAAENAVEVFRRMI
jgi:rhamnulokinase